MELTRERKDHIDSLSIYDLLSGIRFTPFGNPWFQDETGKYWMERYAEIRDKDPVAHTRASKDMGWR